MSLFLENIEKAHQEVLTQMREFMGYEVPQQKIVVGSVDLPSYDRLSGTIYMPLLDATWATKLFPDSRRDFFKVELSHEYAHVVFNDRLGAGVKRALFKHLQVHSARVPGRPGDSFAVYKAGVLSHGVNEAFAFWTEGQFGGRMEIADHVVEKYDQERPGCGQALRFFYEQFASVGFESGPAYVVANLAQIVEEKVGGLQIVL